MKATLDRMRNWITTLVGLILIIVAITMFVMGKFKGYEFTTLEAGAVLALGWVFLNAKDTLIEGLFFSVFKVKRSEDGK